MTKTRKPYLISRCQLQGALACLSDDDTRYALTSINIRPECVEATNRHVLVQIPHDKLDPADFPLVPGAPTEAPDTFLLPGDTAKALLKALPKKSTTLILTYAQVGVREGSVVGAVTDLDTATVPTARLPESTFPNSSKAIPQRTAPLFALGAPALERLLKVAKATDKVLPRLMFYAPKDKDSAIRIEIPHEESDKPIVAVIMPCKADWPEESESVGHEDAVPEPEETL